MYATESEELKTDTYVLQSRRFPKPRWPWPRGEPFPELLQPFPKCMLSTVAAHLVFALFEGDEDQSQYVV